MAAVQKYGIFRLSVASQSSCQSHLRILPLGDVNSKRTAWRRSDYFYPEMIPEPDYSSEEEEEEEEGEEEEADEEDSIDEEAEVDPKPKRTDPNQAKTQTKTQEHRPDRKSQQVETKRKSRPSAATTEDDPRKARPMHTRDASVTKGSTKPRVSRMSDEGLVVPKKPSNSFLDTTQRQKLHKELKFSQKYGKNHYNPRSELQIALDRFQEEKYQKNLAAAKKTSLEKILEIQAKKIDLEEQEGLHQVPEWINRLKEQQDAYIPADNRTEEFIRVHARVMNLAGGSTDNFNDNTSSRKSLSKDENEEESD